MRMQRLINCEYLLARAVILELLLTSKLGGGTHMTRWRGRGGQHQDGLSSRVQ
jgi:hypothetical protein